MPGPRTRPDSPASRGRSHPTRAAGALPTVQPLEARQLLTASFDAATRALSVNGTWANDTIEVRYTARWLSVVENGVTTFGGRPGDVRQITVHGNAGDDTIDYTSGVTGGRLYGDEGRDVIRGSAGADVIWGGGGNDTTYGNDGADEIDGGANDDLLDGGRDADVLWGGAGADTADYSGRSILGVTVSLDGVADDGAPLEADNVHADVENVNGTSRDDHVTGNSANNVLRGSGGNDVLVGNDGDDCLFGEGGDDRLYGGAGFDDFWGGHGDDVLVSIDSWAADDVNGEGGYDTFWTDELSAFGSTFYDPTDADPGEAVSSLHPVASFDNGVDRTLDGDDILDPTDAGDTQDFSDRPLFAADGPSQDDVYQGGLGDCYFLATLAAIAKTDPDYLRQRVAELGDGTYVVRFDDDGADHYVRVDGDLPGSAMTLGPTAGQVNMDFAGLGREDSTWVAIMEKAWAYFRTGENTYASIESGSAGRAFGALGADHDKLDSSSNGDWLLDYIAGELDAGNAVTFATRNRAPDDSPCVGDHAYTVERVEDVWRADGDSMVRETVLVLRNPWGWDGTGFDSDPYDGYVTLTADQAQDVFSTVHSAYV